MSWYKSLANLSGVQRYISTLRCGASLEPVARHDDGQALTNYLLIHVQFLGLNLTSNDTASAMFDV